MWPLSGASNPATSRRQVVLPDPEGPSMAKNSPDAICSETPSTARTVPYARETSRNSIAEVMRERRSPRGTRGARDKKNPDQIHIFSAPVYLVSPVEIFLRYLPPMM